MQQFNSDTERLILLSILSWNNTVQWATKITSVFQLPLYYYYVVTQFDKFERYLLLITYTYYGTYQLSLSCW